MPCHMPERNFWKQESDHRNQPNWFRSGGQTMKTMNINPAASLLDGALVALCGCEPEELRPVIDALHQNGCIVYPAETIGQLDELLGKRPINVIMIHVCPSRQQFLPILGRPDLAPVVPLLRHADKHMYLHLLRQGAFDCVPLPVQSGELKRVLSLAIEANRKRIVASDAA